MSNLSAGGLRSTAAARKESGSKDSGAHCLGTHSGNRLGVSGRRDVGAGSRRKSAAVLGPVPSRFGRADGTGEACAGGGPTDLLFSDGVLLGSGNPLPARPTLEG